MAPPTGFDPKQAHVVSQWPYDRPLNACRFDPAGRFVFCGSEDAAVERFDERLVDVLGALRESDLLVITADHGNDPTTPSTDHSREYVPILVTGARVRAAVDLGTRLTFADLGQTLADNFGVGPLVNGTSFLDEIVGARL